MTTEVGERSSRQNGSENSHFLGEARFKLRLAASSASGYFQNLTVSHPPRRGSRSRTVVLLASRQA